MAIDKRSSKKGGFWEVLSLLFLIVVLVFGGRGVWGMYEKHSEALLHRVDAEEKLKSVDDRKIFLIKEIDRLNSPAGLEAELRKRFTVKKEGEEVIIITKEEPVSTLDDENPVTRILDRVRAFFQ